jgi:hypothetical protein
MKNDHLAVAVMAICSSQTHSDDLVRSENRALVLEVISKPSMVSL